MILFIPVFVSFCVFVSFFKLSNWVLFEKLGEKQSVIDLWGVMASTWRKSRLADF